MLQRKLMIRFSSTEKFNQCDYYLKSVIRQAISRTLEYEDFPADAEVSVTLCNNEYIRKLNKKYRNIDRSTDVLSFPMYDFSEEEIYEDSVILGDIVISVERAEEQAREIGHTFVEEVAFLCIHSTLHLLGYDHELSKEEEEMQCLAQREIVSTLEL